MTRPQIPSAAALIAAAGSGTRLGGARKQFRRLGDKPLLVQTILRFQEHAKIDAIVIAAPAAEVGTTRRMCSDFGLTKVTAVVSGGETRQDSIRSALAALPAASRIVLTHDAVRPFVSGSEINALLEALATHEAAVLGAPVTDTLCRTDAGEVSERLERAGVFRLLTPQAFRREVLERGHDLAAAESKQYTDEVTLVKALGTQVVVVPCSSPNIKITTTTDWAQAQWMWPAWVREQK